MRFRILALILIILLILGCVERGNLPKQTPVVTPTEEEREQINQKGEIIPTRSEISKAVRPTPKVTGTIYGTSTQRESSLYSLEVPPGVEYEWIDLNETLGTITVNGKTYKTGILGKMYVPKEIELNRDYPIYLLLSRNPEVSELALFGGTLCISPSFVLDILNERLDLYLHLGVGGVAFGHYCWDKFTKHWFIRNIYSKSGFNLSCKIDDRLYTVNLSELNPNEWQVYRIYLMMKTPRENPNVALKQSLKNELSAISESYDGLWIPIQDDKIGLWIERLEDNEYLAELYLNELTLRICAPGLGVVFGIPPSVELWIHASGGINDWDQYPKHKQIVVFTLSEKPPESSWKRIEVFKVRFDKLRPYVTSVETIENGNLEGIVMSDEKVVQWVYPELYYVKVKGTLTIDYNYQKSVNITLYYTKSKGFKKGEKVIGFVKLVTIKTTEKPIVYLSAIGNCYWIDRILPPWITNVTVQTTPTPEFVPTGISTEQPIISIS